MNQPNAIPHSHRTDRSRREQAPAPRLRFPNRQATVTLPLDQLIADDHPVRALWHFVTTELDLSPLVASFKTLPHRPGRTPFAPHTLVALWLFATSNGVQSGRALERLCTEHLAYRWLCGGVPINYHTLDDFRAAHGDWLAAQAAHVVRAMEAEGLIDYGNEILGQDGMRVRANAGAGSFRSEQRLAEWAEQAEQADEDEPRDEPEPTSAVQAAARRRAQRERRARIAQAQQELQQVKQAKEKRKKGDGKHARASVTDPEARKMKMADGGIRPGYNVQFATLLGSLVIVGMFVSNSGSDAQQVEPMLQQLRGHYQGQLPRQQTVDGGFSSQENIEAAADHSIELFSPLKEAQQLKDKGIDPFAPRKGDSAAMAQWRQRMGTPEAADVYGERCKCELPHAWIRNRGIGQVSVRSQDKVQAQMGWHVLAYNYQRLCALRAAQATSARCAG